MSPTPRGQVHFSIYYFIVTYYPAAYFILCTRYDQLPENSIYIIDNVSSNTV